MPSAPVPNRKPTPCPDSLVVARSETDDCAYLSFSRFGSRKRPPAPAGPIREPEKAACQASNLPRPRTKLPVLTAASREYFHGLTGHPGRRVTRDATAGMLRAIWWSHDTGPRRLVGLGPATPVRSGLDQVREFWLLAIRRKEHPAKASPYRRCAAASAGRSRGASVNAETRGSRCLA
jgi:hypothetical protein